MSNDKFGSRLRGQSGFMKPLFVFITVLAFFFCVQLHPAKAQESFTSHGSTVLYQQPDLAQWKVDHNGVHEQSKGYLLMFKHVPIRDAQGRDIEPVMAVICESVPKELDVIQYSIAKRSRTPFDVKEVLTPQHGYFTHKNAVGFRGEYKKGSVLHKVIIGYLRDQGAGIQVICDSTDGVYDKVEPDMLKLLRSISFKE